MKKTVLLVGAVVILFSAGIGYAADEATDKNSFTAWIHVDQNGPTVWGFWEHSLGERFSVLANAIHFFNLDITEVDLALPIKFQGDQLRIQPQLAFDFQRGEDGGWQVNHWSPQIIILRYTDKELGELWAQWWLSMEETVDEFVYIKAYYGRILGNIWGLDVGLAPQVECVHLPDLEDADSLAVGGHISLFRFKEGKPLPYELAIWAGKRIQTGNAQAEGWEGRLTLRIPF